MSELATAQVANAAVLPSPGAGILQRKCACGNHTIAEAECESCKKEAASNSLQRKATSPRMGNEVPPIVHEVLRSSGQPLDLATRNFMRSRLGHDFSQVRVHTDSQAAKSARALNALAYTVGRDLVFAAGEYRPQDVEGKRLLAHELTHVIQQRHSSYNAGVQPRLRVSDENDPAEREADQIAEGCLGSHLSQSSPQQVSGVSASPKISPVATPTIQRRVSVSMGKITHKLTYRFTDWAVTNKDAREVLNILKALSDQDLKDTVAQMEHEGLVDRFFENLSKKDIKANQEALVRIKTARVYKEVTKVGGKTVTTTTTGSCSPSQNRTITAMLNKGLGWLTKAIGLIDAYLSTPSAASTRATQNALTAHYRTAAVNVATYVRGQLARFEADLRNRSLYSFECHGSWDLTCGSSGAYVPGDNSEMVVFCSSFFQGDITDGDIRGFLHEIAHTQVGGTPITDRAYRSNRMLKHLTTAEALTNAESYSLFIQHLASGKAPESKAPADDYEDCPKEWRPALAKALAKAQRWNRDAQVSVATLTPTEAKTYGKDDIARMGGTSEKDIEKLQKAFNTLADELRSSIDFECEPKGGGRCDKGVTTYWYAAGDFHICPSWIQQTPDEQVVSLLAGLYGYKADVGDNKRRFNYARFAQASANEAAPALPTILGSAAWTPDSLRVWLVPKTPATGEVSYLESGAVHERMSHDLPAYQVPPCYSRSLPFEASVAFAVDRVNTPRPAPFTPPSVSAEFRYMGERGPIRKAVSDPRADYSAAGFSLDTKFDSEFSFNFTRNGPFSMRLEMRDADTGVNRVYEDTIDVETSRPCDLPNKRPEKQLA